MKMPVSNATPVHAPSTVSGTSTVKGTEGNEFNQTLVQTLAGNGAGSTPAQPSKETAVVSQLPVNSLASLLGDNVSAGDLLAAIEELLKKLDAADSEELAQTTTEGSLSDALAQLDNLLSMLSGMPAAQPVLALTTNQTADSNNAPNQGESNGGINELLTIIAGLNNGQSIAANIQGQASPMTTDASSTESANLEAIAALKSGLQDALSDLRLLLQQQKGNAADSEQNGLVSKQLIAIEQLINGKKSEAAVMAAAQSSNPSNEIDSVRALQTAPSTNNHLQRMAHQLLHVGLMKAAAKPEGTEQFEVEPFQSLSEPSSINLALLAGNQELQRQTLTAAKQLVEQPVPIQQFASTIQKMVVSQFNVTASNGMSNAQLTLFPEHLGQVNVNISMHNGTLTAQFVTDSALAKDMLENQMAQLRTSLLSQGMQVEKLEVTQAPVLPNMFQDRQGQSGRDQGTSKRQSGDEAIGEIDFESGLEEVTMEQAVDRDLGLGRGIHTRA
ncbi:flagellar hook-length control protein FliK [Paenibacillus sp. CF384]|uniref:flagellar hook-length control protein FliK n=1 Tax=Paenibacillus sp. CF384 TaxID=1884382 RepID=UPI00089A46C3|nr:flagellar hook-length control protein FliK [Paenibacillus sp. CF384]SDW27609.1 Flagellar hook-length control protein FliK [Paenibacillus sp. CF384]